MTTHIQEIGNPEVDLLEEEKLENKLIVHNDDVNTFDWVIISLMKVCKHDPIQAEQCSLIIHNTGKCAVKHGEMDVLKPMKDALLERSIQATIE